MELQAIALLALLMVIAFTMNVVPVLGPPLWTVVALFVRPPERPQEIPAPRPEKVREPARV